MPTKHPIKSKNKKTSPYPNEFSLLSEEIIAKAGVGIYIVQNRKFVYTSNLFQIITGFTDDDLIGASPLDRVYPEDQENVRQHAVKCLKKEIFEPYEFRLFNKDNQLRWILETVTPIVYKGQPATLGSFMDITERKMTEEALRQSEEKYRTIIENIEDGYVEMDLKGNFIFFNDAISKMHGFTSIELLKMNYTDVMDEENAAKIYAKYNHVFKTGIPEKDFEYQIITKDGQRKFLETSISLINNSAGRIIAFRGIVRDRTQRKQAEEALRQSEEKYRSILENIEEGFFEVDLAGNFTFFNHSLCSLLGYSREETLGMNYRQYTDKDSAQDVFRTFNGIFRTGMPVKEFDWFIIRKNKTRRYVEASIYLKKDSSGKPTGFQGFTRDVTDRIQAEFQKEAALEALRESEEKYRNILENIQEAYFEVDLAGNFTFFNDALCRMTGCSKEELRGTNYTKFSDEENSKKVFQVFNKVFNTGQPTEGFDWLIIRKDSTKRYIEASVSLKKDSHGHPAGFKGVIRDISERKRIEQELNYMATHDALTGLPNRLMFNQLLNQAILSAKRHKKQLAVFFIDLDRFKIINDTLGHDAGDLLLQEIARRFRHSLRAVDVVGRLGGDEFVILIEDFSDFAQVSKVAHKILSAAIKPMVIMSEECRVTASIGISIFPKDGQDEQSLMKNADIAMYFAKEEGKNNFQYYSKDIKTQSNERLSIETNLRRALERDEFYLTYQARLDFKSNQITGVEALLRWNNPYLGQVTPTQFIPLAEETGLIVPIGRWVLKTACAQNMAWQKQNLPPICMAVNLSLRQLSDENLLNDIRMALNESGMPPQLLELEITESMVMHNPAKLIQLLTKIKDMGVRLAIDDFGTGYSSLAQIKHYPIDTLKVDRSFIRNLPKDSEDKAITEAIITMGKTLSLTVVAEGVETLEQENYLREHVCDEMQGFYFSKPVKADDFAELLRNHTGAHLT
ncbi:MAG TPA: PAS domain S-box protein [Smithella sp.]|jgi:diguanylate cyclase (GGDEF)-like protein/PAS domain S-box-containing protein|nr:PAS domain S-box protein [Smithella sp.]OQC51582.1 MAG: Phytochrome-like protein cph2 [Deltaproteobacteria bacterium ADurb.Bin022]HNQ64763.1 PAS domain S-box protein [Smithella sp.]HOE32376.1 PAS domain S-box protein [Smithella sp.]HOG08981.1 PAS domain S-box protein [Smithella sp.]